MSSFPEIKAALHNEAWAISRSAFDALRADVERIQAAGKPSIDEMLRGKVLSIDGDVATLRVHGVLVQNPSLLAKLFLGVTDTNDIAGAVEDLRGNDSVKRVIVHVNSPGGQARGVHEVASALGSLAKDTVAFVDGVGASGAYWIAAACDRVECSPGSFVGSIGVFTTFLDTSEAEARAGLKQIVLSSGDLKAAGETGSLSDEQRKHMQNTVNDVAEMFFSFVRTHRKGIDAEVFRGGAYIGGRAKALGLVDDTRINFESFRKTMSGHGTGNFSARGGDAIARLEARCDEYLTSGRARIFGGRNRATAQHGEGDMVNDDTKAAVIAAQHGDEGARKNLIAKLEQEWRADAALQADYVSASSYAHYRLAILQGRQQEIRS